MIDVRLFSEKNIDDVAMLVQGRGLSTTVDYLRSHLLANPNLAEATEFTPGITVYDGDRCVAFQGLAYRKLYLLQTLKWGREGTVLAIDKDYSCVIGELMAAIKQPRGQAVGYGNTSVPRTTKLFKILGMHNPGPESCEKIAFTVLRWGAFAGVLLRKRGVRIPMIVRSIVDLFGRAGNLMFYRRHRTKTVSERVAQIDDVSLRVFWDEYLAVNDGVVTSRAPDELNWLFGEGLAAGRFVMLVGKIEQRVVGYVILKQQVSDIGLRWMVADWIALNNDPDVLHDLLLDARRFAATTDAFCMESTGFPMKIQPVVKACLPLTRKALCNTFSYTPFDDSMKDALQLTPDKGWFWGPMDGDRCVN